MDGEKEKTLIEILEENIHVDLAKYINFVRTPQSGAIATFSGTTRDTFEGKTVLELRYEAYVPMAERQIKSICSSARISWNLDTIAVAHRLGPVPVGETSVFIAISSVHRADALDACKYVIDEIKASVPIWKKEVYTNGEVWKENSEFLERRVDFGGNSSGSLDREGGACCGSKVKVATQERKGCCGNKVKVRDEEVAYASRNDDDDVVEEKIK
ncbi:Molybdopterin biosynthesis MoaE [Macleaya cordata]|uniref:Molybdopterin synthase catalytic subunit n=1 Tax=Macleaya cordata TaxID=56857 RepID=A0A200Q0B1_MACCD|nr:Molybdopterin biosynthesis MoaE [Macleaya cordata]